MVSRIFGAIAALLLCLLPGAVQATPHCDAVVPPVVAVSPHKRTLVAEDLVGLRDIGPVDPLQQYAGLFSVSPDGRRAAFQVRRGDPENNNYCLAMIVVDLTGKGKAVAVDRGGDFIRLRFDFRGKASFPSGFAETITPRWTPDGRSIFYRRRDKGAVQLWQARTDGSGSASVTDSADDIDDFRLTTDGNGIVYTTRPGLREASAAIDKEGLSGFHYDDRFSPTSSNRPFVPAPIPRTFWYLDIASRQLREATPEEAGLLDQVAVQEGGWTEAAGPSGATALVQVPRASLYPSRGRLTVRRADRLIACGAPECADASYPWWAGDTIRFLRREGCASLRSGMSVLLARPWREDDVLVHHDAEWPAGPHTDGRLDAEVPGDDRRPSRHAHSCHRGRP